jgi:hypothetical protein
MKYKLVHKSNKHFVKSGIRFPWLEPYFTELAQDQSNWVG